MKKVLSLLLVCAMVLSLATISVSAAGEGYAAVSGSYKSYKSGRNTIVELVSPVTTFDSLIDTTVYPTDADAENGANVAYTGKNIVITISTAIDGALGGYVAVDYDATKVFPAIIEGFENEAYISLEKAVNNDSITSWLVLGDGITLETNNTKIGANTVTVSWYPAAAMAPGKVVELAFVTKEGVTADDFDANTFKIADAANVKPLVDSVQAGNVETDGTTAAVKNAAGMSKGIAFTYPGSDKTVGGEEGGEEGGDDFVEGDWNAVDTEVKGTWASETFQYVADNNGEAGAVTTGYEGKKVVAFGKNASNKAYVSGEYGVTIGANKYPGLATVEVGQTFAIVLIDTNNDAKVKGTYTYSIWTLENGAEVTKASGLNAQ